MCFDPVSSVLHDFNFKKMHINQILRLFPGHVCLEGPITLVKIEDFSLTLLLDHVKVE